MADNSMTFSNTLMQLGGEDFLREGENGRTMEREFSAVVSLKRNVKFWFECCGCNNEQVISNVKNSFDFAYCSAEQEQAKNVIISALTGEEKRFDCRGIRLLEQPDTCDI